jgi:hypothetical protein
MKNAIFWDMIPCGCCKNGRFGPTRHSSSVLVARENNGTLSVTHCSQQIPRCEQGVDIKIGGRIVWNRNRAISSDVPNSRPEQDRDFPAKPGRKLGRCCKDMLIYIATSVPLASERERNVLEIP